MAFPLVILSLIQFRYTPYIYLLLFPTPPPSLPGKSQSPSTLNLRQRYRFLPMETVRSGSSCHPFQFLFHDSLPVLKGTAARIRLSNDISVLVYEKCLRNRGNPGKPAAQIPFVRYQERVSRPAPGGGGGLHRSQGGGPVLLRAGGRVQPGGVPGHGDDGGGGRAAGKCVPHRVL